MANAGHAAPDTHMRRNIAARIDEPLLQGTRILLVEDDADSQAMIYRLLAGSGASVAIAGNATNALERLAGEPFDLLVSDIGMPEQDGYWLLRQIRSRGLAEWLHPRDRPDGLRPRGRPR